MTPSASQARHLPPMWGDKKGVRFEVMKKEKYFGTSELKY
jgi:hypothetical protein